MFQPMIRIRRWLSLELRASMSAAGGGAPRGGVQVEIPGAEEDQLVASPEPLRRVGRAERFEVLRAAAAHDAQRHGAGQPPVDRAEWLAREGVGRAQDHPRPGAAGDARQERPEPRAGRGDPQQRGERPVPHDRVPAVGEQLERGVGIRPKCEHEQDARRRVRGGGAGEVVTQAEAIWVTWSSFSVHPTSIRVVGITITAPARPTHASSKPSPPPTSPNTSRTRRRPAAATRSPARCSARESRSSRPSSTTTCVGSTPPRPGTATRSSDATSSSTMRGTYSAPPTSTRWPLARTGTLVWPARSSDDPITSETTVKRMPTRKTSPTTT
jgi:hypothetical protein